MTIAAGFACEDGFLICADTKITTNIKTNESKLVHYVSNDRNCSLTFAISSDDMNFPKAAIIACWEFVGNLDFNTATMETVRNAVAFSLAEFYRDHIYPHPDRNPSSVFMKMLVGIWLHGQTSLYESHETLLAPVDGYECIGSGSVLAKYLVRQYLKANGLPETVAEASLLASCVVEAAIEYDEFCGGEAEMILVRNNGIVDTIADPVLYPGYKLLKSLQEKTWGLMRRLAAQEITNSEIDITLQDHFDRIRSANNVQMITLDVIRRARGSESYEW